MSEALSQLAHVCLVIATFKQDAAVIGLLDDVFATCPVSPFHQIIIVDSMGSGKIAAHIEARGWAGVSYHTFEQNLGSAGNLAKRLELAAASEGARWAYAINHDGEVRWDALERLVARASRGSSERIGALYPLRYTTGIGKYNLTGRSSLPIPYVGTRVKPRASFPVWWASSNGALYALAPVREGLGPWADLWMGWEDLGYGWQLARHGWSQEVVSDAVFEDSYEYRAVGAGGARVNVTDKPTWYAYYQLRNLILVTRRNGRGAATWGVVAARAALEFGLTAAVRPDKLRRARFLTRGVVDGLLDKSGKWHYP
jgi:hypothetical protein